MIDYNRIADAFLVRLKGEIPLVNHLGLSPLQWDGQTLAMTAALAPNVNDKGTGFGGSLATIATLCGWSIVMLYLRAKGRDDDVVIRDSHLEYFLPVTSDFTAKTSLPEPALLTAFYQKMLEKGRARIDLVIEIKQGDKVAMRLTGSYVALEKQR
ncbi:YiiD C-terminal domain-containing protein [Neptuniibacter pectenicola]|mgnify:FL=1|uniref:YiiD C-terminal domain-containing protein n=1 Tax=Neptuniibacter pectenicola TaxID=1806669 RepID=A0ABU9TPS9_9GAMM|nr:YiiD C-terminal domain-containing protein [Neptuniibacter pectenicola]